MRKVGKMANIHRLAPEDAIPAISRVVRWKLLHLEDLLSPTAVYLKVFYLNYITAREDQEKVITAIAIWRKGIWNVDLIIPDHPDEQVVSSCAASRIGYRSKVLDGALRLVNPG